MQQAATIKLFLPSGNARGLRTAEISNWSGKAIAGPRSELDDLLNREELHKPGVYFLTGTDLETGDPSIYVGEAEIVKTRIKQHKEKDFWVHTIIFISKDENLTKAHIKYLEGKLIAKALQIGKAKLENGQASGAILPESDRADMDVFLEKIYQLLPVLGTDVFIPLTTHTPRQKSTLLYCTKKSSEAKGQRTENGFVVFKNSQASIKETPSVPKTIKERRSALKNKGILIQEENALIFSQDHEFSSPSLAAAVVLGVSANGLIQWKDKQGRTLKSIEEKS